MNAVVGAVERNAAAVVQMVERAADAGAEVVLFPEMVLSGYPPEDLLLKDHFIEACERALTGLGPALPERVVAIVGSPRAAPGRPANAAVVFHGGREVASYQKRLLPNYGVFDEKRVLSPGEKGVVLCINGVRCGLHICEDSWLVDAPPCEEMAGVGVDLLLNLSSSPYHRAKLLQREEVMRRMGRALDSYVAYCNLVGGQDELVFDGASRVLAPDGERLLRAAQFEEDLAVLALPVTGPSAARPSRPDVDWVELSAVSDAPAPPPPEIREPLPELEEVYRALQLGLHDYVDKNGFRQVVVAISGGIDSALVAALAVDALGPEAVTGITMPSPYSSEGTRSDAYQLAENLGITMRTVAIRDLFQHYEETLRPLWPDREPDVTEENLQARIRGNIVMALSNKFGWLVLTTGNKSELATGYCTLYGDMAGGFAVIKDVPKTLVYKLCRWRNQRQDAAVIPEDIITRPPSAELRPDQRDTDSLPPYDILDGILERYVEQDLGLEAIVAAGFDPATVERIMRLVDLSEYKRRQGPPGVKITPKAFGRDRRLPITNRFREKPTAGAPEGSP